mmetsp:Transcript_17438/g.47056  ORF Transcript_17438/g.47056 Transcript_17438/m.47056 type:complete len:190 (+) Transcript_17438:3-572(+)
MDTGHNFVHGDEDTSLFTGNNYPRPAIARMHTDQQLPTHVHEHKSDAADFIRTNNLIAALSSRMASDPACSLCFENPFASLDLSCESQLWETLGEDRFITVMQVYNYFAPYLRIEGHSMMPRRAGPEAQDARIHHGRPLPPHVIDNKTLGSRVIHSDEASYLYPKRRRGDGRSIGELLALSRVRQSSAG